MRTYLDPILRPGLTVVFAGTEPGRESLRRGHYYSHAGNSFWADLEASGWTPQRLRPEDDSTLLSLGIGLDDVYADAKGLRRRIERAAPRAVCFNSKQALQRFTSVDPTAGWQGAGASLVASFDGVDVVWALPDSSGRAERFRPLRRSLLAGLRERLQADQKI